MAGARRGGRGAARGRRGQRWGCSRGRAPVSPPPFVLSGRAGRAAAPAGSPGPAPRTAWRGSAAPLLSALPPDAEPELGAAGTKGRRAAHAAAPLLSRCERRAPAALPTPAEGGRREEGRRGGGGRGGGDAGGAGRAAAPSFPFSLPPFLHPSLPGRRSPPQGSAPAPPARTRGGLRGGPGRPFPAPTELLLRGEAAAARKSPDKEQQRPARRRLPRAPTAFVRGGGPERARTGAAVRISDSPRRAERGAARFPGPGLFRRHPGQQRAAQTLAAAVLPPALSSHPRQDEHRGCPAPIAPCAPTRVGLGARTACERSRTAGKGRGGGKRGEEQQRESLLRSDAERSHRLGEKTGELGAAPAHLQATAPQAARSNALS